MGTRHPSLWTVLLGPTLITRVYPHFLFNRKKVEFLYIIVYIIINQYHTESARMSDVLAWYNATQQQQQQQQWRLLVGSHQHTAVVVHQQPVFAYITCIAMNASATALVGFTHTYLQPSFNSQTARCVVSFGSGLTITGMTTDRQWYRLDTYMWIPSSWVQ